MNTELTKHQDLLNPYYVQINRKKACEILGISIAELDRRRNSDPRCPVGFKEKDSQFSAVKFRLSDIYAYSEAIMAGSFQLSRTG